MSPNKHQLRGPSAKYVSASKKARKMEEMISSESKLKVQKVESDEENTDTNFEGYDKSDSKPVHVHVDGIITEGDPRLALLLNRLEEEETNNNGESMGWQW